MDQNEEIFTRFMNDNAFQDVVEETLRQQVYDQIQKNEADA